MTMILLWFAMIWITNVQGLDFTNEPSDVFIRPGKTLWWDCTAVSPEGRQTTYAWMFNGAPVSTSGPQHLIYSNGTLRLDFVQPTNQGQYYCITDDGVNRITSRLAQLTIAYISASFNLHPNGQSPERGSTVRLQCEITSQPPAVITWLHNDAPVTRHPITMVSGRSQLTIQSVQYQDKGRYHCMGRNPLTGETKYSNTAVISPKGGPAWVVEPDPQTINKDSMAFLHCQAEANPSPIINWYHVQGVGQESLIQSNNRFMVFPNGTLRIADTKPEDEGFYKCQAVNSVDSISKTVLLTISELPKRPMFTSIPNNRTVEEGEDVNWFCGARGEPQPSVYWQKDGQGFPGSRVTYPSPGSLMISPTSRTDRGWYTCYAESPAGNNATRAYLNVLYSPTMVEFSPGSVLVETGSQVLLPCVVDSNPRPEILWSTPRGQVTESSSVTIYTNGTLAIDPVNPVHIGTYTCEGRNALGFISQTTQLQVRSKPVLLVPPSDQSVDIGRTLTLDCLAVGYPSPVVVWTRPDGSVLRESDGMQDGHVILSNGSLVVADIQDSHAGVYHCMVQNSLGSVDGNALVKVLDPPVFDPSHYSVIRQLGEDIMMDCQPSGRPAPVVQWAKYDQVLVVDEWMEVFENNSLYIRNMSVGHYGTYQCYAANEAGSARLEVMLLQPDSPVFTVYPSDTSGNMSQPLQVPCEAQSVLIPDISWYVVVEGQLVKIPGPAYNTTDNVTRTDRYVTDAGKLVFMSMLQEDEGVYVCVANNSMGNISHEIFINVQVPPVITMVSTPTSGDVGATTTLTCEVEGDPTPEVIWRSPSGHSIMYTDDFYIVERKTITIKVTNIEEHMGIWLCKACNILGCDEEEINLYVRGPPVITSVDGYMDGLARVLACKAEGTPYPDMYYYWGDLAINPLAPPRGHSISQEGPTLRILRDRVDAVPYKCAATNQFGTDIRVFTVPSAPYSLTLLGIGSREALLTWFPPELTGGLPNLNYSIEYTHTIPDTDIQVVTQKREIQEIPHRLTNLEAYSEYKFRVAAYNILGYSAFTDTVSAKTQEDAPDAVQNLLVSFAGEVLKVTWNAPAKMNGNSSNIEYYVVSKDTYNDETYDTVTVKHGQPLETFLTNADMYGKTIVVRVTAVNTRIGLASDTVNREFSVKHKVPFMVPELTRVASITHDTVDVEWTYPANAGGDILGFHINVTSADQKIFKKDFPVYGHDIRTATVPDLLERNSYGIRVAALSREGRGPYSALRLVTTSYAVFSEIPYRDSQKLSMSGTLIAIILGTISGILLFLVIVLLIWQWYRLHRRVRDKMVADAYRENNGKPSVINLVHPGPYPDVSTQAGKLPEKHPQHQPTKTPTKPKKQPKVQRMQVDPLQIPRPHVIRGPYLSRTPPVQVADPMPRQPPAPRPSPQRSPHQLRPVDRPVDRLQAAGPRQKAPEQRRPSTGFQKPRSYPYGPGRSSVYQVSNRGKPSPLKKRLYKKKADPEPIMAYSEIPMYPSTLPKNGQRSPGHNGPPRDSSNSQDPQKTHQPIRGQPNRDRHPMPLTRLSASEENLVNQHLGSQSPSYAPQPSASSAQAARVKPPPDISRPPERPLPDTPQASTSRNGRPHVTILQV